jgi:hypothetical protein
LHPNFRHCIPYWPLVLFFEIFILYKLLVCFDVKTPRLPWFKGGIELNVLAGKQEDVVPPPI